MMEGAQTVLSPEAVFRVNEPLGRKTTLGVGGFARYYAEPATIDDLQFLLEEASRLEVPVFFLGRGSNLIAVDGEIPSLVIRLQHHSWRQLAVVDDHRVRVGAGLRLRELCGHAMRIGLGGFEFLEGIPGTVGGALRMNAGAMGGWMFEVVESVRFLTLAGEDTVLGREELHFGYRHCEELQEGCAVEAVLRAPALAEHEAIRAKIGSFQQHRYKSQPKEPSAGCIFKNPEGDSAGRIIDQLGLKGTTCGSAEVSRIHGNFVINKGGATSADVLELIRRIRGEVHRQRGILLEPEVLLLGRTWEEVL
jgi:UDP-N-acetylmuramate--alanine ligase